MFAIYRIGKTNELLSLTILGADDIFSKVIE